MSEHLDGLFERLRGTPPPEPFAAAAAVRHRGRQRSLRQAATIGLALLLVTGLGAASLVTINRPDPQSPVPPAATSPLTAIPDSWLLTAADLGPGRWGSPEFDLYEFENYPWIWLNRCVLEGSFEQLEARFQSLRQRADIAVVEWEDAGRDSSDPGWRVLETVELFAAGAAAANLADVEVAITACDDPYLMWEVVDRDFTGDQALFVEEAEGGFTAYYAVVRVGDAVATVRSTDAQLVRTLAPRAASRLG